MKSEENENESVENEEGKVYLPPSASCPNRLAVDLMESRSNGRGRLGLRAASLTDGGVRVNAALPDTASSAAHLVTHLASPGTHRLRTHLVSLGRIAWIRDASLGYIRDASLEDSWGRIAWRLVGTHRLLDPWPRDLSPCLELETSPLGCANSPPVFLRSWLRHQPTWGRISELSSGDLAYAISPPGDASPSCVLEISPASSAHLGTYLRAVV
ncbi:hypothetical protein R1sor_008908 [Riccia sorocarpa]|uniref:Uncharacterized protein n=1 Tax=Riccia sorocarpa TaxID=122646 RepID=A0ABD3H876_9MARC